MEAGTSPEAEAAAAERARKEAAAALLQLSPETMEASGRVDDATGAVVAVAAAAPDNSKKKKRKQPSPSACAAAAATVRKKQSRGLPMASKKTPGSDKKKKKKLTARDVACVKRKTPKTSNTTNTKNKTKKKPAPKAKRRLEPGSSELTAALEAAVADSDSEDDNENKNKTDGDDDTISTKNDNDKEQAEVTVIATEVGATAAGASAGASASTGGTVDASVVDEEASMVKAVTTSRGKKKKKKDPNEGVIKVGCRIRVLHKELKHCLRQQEQRDAIRRNPNNTFYYGTVISGDSKNGYTTQIDSLPDEHQYVFLTRKKLYAMKPGSEEPPFDHELHMIQTCATIDDLKKKKTPSQESTDEFLSTGKYHIAGSTIFEHKFGKGDDDYIAWKIHGDTEYVNIPFKLPEKVEYKKDLPWNPTVANNNYNTLFFDKFFPSIKGHAAIIDKYLSSPECEFHNTVVNDKIVFHDPEAEDPDWRVRVCYTLLIAAASEIEVGVENLWKSGPSGGRHSYPDFGKYMPINYFKAFQHAAAYCWCPEDFWYIPKDDKPWEVILPCLQALNDKQKELLSVVLLILDELMSGWRPKTSQLGGLLNITFEPRKPVDLGTMFRNSAECITGCMINLDPVQLPEHQMKKEFHGKPTHLPTKAKIDNATAEVLRQIKNSGVEKGKNMSDTEPFCYRMLDTEPVCYRLASYSDTNYQIPVIPNLFATDSLPILLPNSGDTKPVCYRLASYSDTEFSF